MRYLFPTGKGYQRKWLGQDVLSGVVIAAVSIPISMGYAQIAGLPAVYGLYGSLLPVILFALLSTSPQFIFGVDAAPAAMIGGVLKMSELYSVSLDYLLKGEGPMKDYLDYIEESTNTVKSKVRLSKLLLVLSYLVIWAFNIMASWRFSAGSITEAQAGGAQWIMLPAATIVLSLLIGKNNYWGKYKWLAPIGFGLMFMLSVYASYGMRESLIFDRVDLQTLSVFFIGTIASMIGMALGHALFADEKSKEKSE